MELKEILSIVGRPGLYRFVAQSRHGLIVEPLGGGARFAVPVVGKVSALSDISMYMENGDLPLSDVFTTMLAAESRIAACDLSSAEAARILYGELFPSYDPLRVRDKHILKAFHWFTLLRSNGMERFTPAPSSDNTLATDDTPASKS